MHEISVALGIVEIAEVEAAKANAKTVETITLEIGTLAGIEFKSFDFVWPTAIEGTILENSNLELKIIKAKAKCTKCNSVFKMKQHYDHCPNCKSDQKSIFQGEELNVKSLDII